MELHPDGFKNRGGKVFNKQYPGPWIRKFNLETFGSNTLIFILQRHAGVIILVSVWTGDYRYTEKP